MNAGYGSPPARYTRLVNQSRIGTLMDCETHFINRYIWNRVPDYPDAPALQIGTIWHRAAERLAEGTAVSDTAAQTISECEAASVEADSLGFDGLAKNLRKFALFAEHAIPVYAERYAGEHPTGQTLATEQEFWLELSPDSALVGRIDKIGYVPSKGIVNGEVKTVGKDTDMTAWMAFREHSLQDKLYHLALVHAPRPADWPDAPVYGTVYDLTFKHDYPLKASRSGTLEERRADWPRKLFYTQAIPRNIDEEPVFWAGFTRKFMDRPPSYPQRNTRSCMQFGRRACPYFAACWEGVPLDSTRFRDRTPDYTDRSHHA